MDRLSGVEGLDAESALRHAGGRPQTLERVLRQFLATYRDGEPALLIGASDDAIVRWRRACHSLRGVCATVGALALLRSLQAFEHAMAAQADDPALAAQARDLDEDLRGLVSRIDAAIKG